MIAAHGAAGAPLDCGWPTMMRATRQEIMAGLDPRAIDLASALDTAAAGFLDGFAVAPEDRAGLAVDAISLFLVRAAGNLPPEAPFVSRLEWLLTRVSQRAWALQLASVVPQPRDACAGEPA